MKPAPFEYVAPTTVAEVVTLLAENEGDAVVLAGGQSLIPALNFRLGGPAVIVDINGIAGLAGFAEDVQGGFRIGALTRQRSVVDDVVLQRRTPVLSRAVRHIGHTPIRNRGTVGGSVAHADPAAEIPAVLALHDAMVELTSVRGSRSIAVGDFILGPYLTAKSGDELVTAVILPPLPDARYGFHEVARRPGDFALAGAVASLQTNEGNVTAARVVLFGVEPAPRRLRAVESALAGARASDVASIAYAATTDTDLDVLDDPQIPTGYRAHLAAVAVERAVAEAA